MSGDAVSYKELYELVDKTMGKLNKSIAELRQEFRLLEAGRLTRLETKVAEMEAEQKLKDEAEKNSLMRKLGYKVVEYIILAFLGAVLYLILK